MSGFRRWLVMACLCLSGGIIFLLPFLREVYYIPLQKALDLTNTQLGVLSGDPGKSPGRHPESQGRVRGHRRQN